MTLPNYPSPISLTQIRDEYGQTGTVNLLDYYAGGGIVPPGTVGYPNGISTPIPASGALSLQNFYGSSAISIIELQSSGSWEVPTGVTSISLLMVGGGGGGGSGTGADGGGGGGAGAVYFATGVSVTPGAFIPVIIGAGGAGTNDTTRGTVGADTIFDTLYAIGGGGGGGSGGGGAESPGGSGGSGGGACGYNGVHSGGVSTALGLGNAGGDAGRYNSGGGGGGRSAVGQGTADQEGTETTPGKGGAGFELLLPINSQITPWTGSYGSPYISSSIVLGGGGGGGRGASVTPGIGGSDIGGTGGVNTTTAATNGVIRTGSGGGGGYADASPTAWPGGNGSSGSIYIIYATPTRVGPISTFDSAMDTKSYGDTGATATSGITLNTDGTISVINLPLSGPILYIRNTVGTNWYSATTPGIGSSHWAYVTHSVTSGGTGTVNSTGTYNSWVNLGSSQTWELSSIPDPDNLHWAYDILTIDISETSGGPVVASATIQLTVLSTGTITPVPPPPPP